MIKQIKRMALLLLGSAILGTLFLVLVFLLPTEPMKEHVAASVERMIKSEEEVPDNAFSRYIWGEKETYTDAIMVQNAIEKIPGKNVFEHAMWVYHSDLEPEIWTPEASLEAYCSGEGLKQPFLHEYSRYWHGYLIYLKPLLLVFSWSQIVALGVFLQVLLLAGVIFFSVKKGKPEVGIAVTAGFLFMKPLLVMISLTMSVCFIITLAVVLVMLFYHSYFEKKGLYPEVFLITGILTAYFDFLTYPAVTLGFPLCAYFLLKRKEDAGMGQNCFKQSLSQVIGYSVCWGIGYAGMWGLKWVIADLTLHTGTIKDALWSIIGRTEAIGGRPRFNGGWYVVGLNLQEYGSILYPAAAAAVAVVVLYMTVRACRRNGIKQTLALLLPYAVIFCIPFVWMIVVQHHSALHARFTFRIISIALLAVCCMGLALWRKNRELKPPEKL